MVKYITDENDEIWVKPDFRFNPSQWGFIQRCMNEVRRVAEDETISDSKAIEFMVADFAAGNGLEIDEEKDGIDTVAYLETHEKIEKGKLQRQKKSDELVVCFIESDGDSPFQEYEVINNANGFKKIVIKRKDGFSCECPDHQFRDHKCKHIRAVEARVEKAIAEHKKSLEQLYDWYDRYDIKYGKWITEGDTLTIITGGWSDNETIVAEMHANFFFMIYWESSHRGGREVFKLPMEIMVTLIERINYVSV